MTTPNITTQILDPGIEVREEGGRVREIVYTVLVDTWWTIPNDGEPVEIPELLVRVLSANESMPQPGDELVLATPPENPRRLYLSARNISVEDNNRARVVLNYVYLGDKRDAWEFDSNLVQEHRFLDRNGNRVSVTQGQPPDTQGASWPAMVPAFRLTRAHPVIVSSEGLAQYSARWLGTINGDAWGPFPPRTLMVTSARPAAIIQPPNGPLVAGMEIELSYYLGDPVNNKTERSGWQPLVYYRQSDQGVPSLVLDEGEGWKMVEQYEEIGDVEWKNEFGEGP